MCIPLSSLLPQWFFAGFEQAFGSISTYLFQVHHQITFEITILYFVYDYFGADSVDFGLEC